MRECLGETVRGHHRDGDREDCVEERRRHKEKDGALWISGLIGCCCQTEREATHRTASTGRQHTALLSFHSFNCFWREREMYTMCFSLPLRCFLSKLIGAFQRRSQRGERHLELLPHILTSFLPSFTSPLSSFFFCILIPFSFPAAPSSYPLLPSFSRHHFH